MATTSQDPSLDPAQAALLARVEPAVLEEQALVTNNRDFNWVTNKICRIVETETPLWWWVCMVVALGTAAFTGVGLLWLVSTGVGPRESHQLGLGDCELRFLDWYWPCGYLDFRRAVFAETRLADID